MQATHPDLLSRSKQPIYLQLVAEFKRNINQGVWPAGSQLPSLENLMATYQVARMTIRNALNILEQEGYIRRGRGLGTFVLERLSPMRELLLPTTWDEVVQLSDELKMEPITERAKKIRNLPEIGFDYNGEYSLEYFLFRRVHNQENIPFCYSEVYLCAELFRKYSKEFRSNAAASVIDRIKDIKINKARQKITISGAGFASAEALNLNVGDSVAEVRRFACSDSKLIYFARLEFPTQFVKLEFDLLRNFN